MSVASGRAAPSGAPEVGDWPELPPVDPVIDGVGTELVIVTGVSGGGRTAVPDHASPGSGSGSEPMEPVASRTTPSLSPVDNSPEAGSAAGRD